MERYLVYRDNFAFYLTRRKEVILEVWKWRGGNGYEGVEWIQLAQDRIQRLARLKIVMNFHVSQMVENVLTS
jgi:hypothetical protein